MCHRQSIARHSPSAAWQLKCTNFTCNHTSIAASPAVGLTQRQVRMEMTGCWAGPRVAMMIAARLPGGHAHCMLPGACTSLQATEIASAWTKPESVDWVKKDCSAQVGQSSCSGAAKPWPHEHTGCRQQAFTSISPRSSCTYSVSTVPARCCWHRHARQPSAQVSIFQPWARRQRPDLSQHALTMSLSSCWVPSKLGRLCHILNTYRTAPTQ
jgi:hypothetical protein